MIVVKHRWKKNRSEQIGDLVLMFGEDSIARVPDQGNNRVTVDLAVKFGKGLLEVVEDKPVQPHKEMPKAKEAPVVVKEVPKAPEAVKEAPKAPEPTKLGGLTAKDPEEVMTSALPKERKEVKTPPKKKATKKTPGRKSSKR
jgi:hypothetical protein